MSALHASPGAEHAWVRMCDRSIDNGRHERRLQEARELGAALAMHSLLLVFIALLWHRHKPAPRCVYRLRDALCEKIRRAKKGARCEYAPHHWMLHVVGCCRQRVRDVSEHTYHRHRHAPHAGHANIRRDPRVRLYVSASRHR